MTALAARPAAVQRRARRSGQAASRSGRSRISQRRALVERRTSAASRRRASRRAEAAAACCSGGVWPIAREQDAHGLAVSRQAQLGLAPVRRQAGLELEARRRAGPGRTSTRSPRGAASRRAGVPAPAAAADIGRLRCRCRRPSRRARSRRPRPRGGSARAVRRAQAGEVAPGRVGVAELRPAPSAPTPPAWVYWPPFSRTPGG